MIYKYTSKQDFNIILFLAFSIFLILSCIFTELNSSYSIYANLNCFFIIYIIFYIKLNGFITLRPELIIMLMSFVCFSLNYILNRSYYDYPISIYNKSALYLGLCILGIVAGCNFPVRKSRETRMKCFKLYPSRTSILVICIFCLFITLFMQVMGYKTTHSAEMDNSSFILDILIMIKGSFLKIIYFDCFFHLIKGKKEKYWKEEIFIVILNFIFAVFSGSRGSAILGLFIIPYIYILYKQKLPFKFFIIAFIFLLIIVPFSIIYRQMDLFLDSREGRSIFAKIPAFYEALKNVKFSSDTLLFVSQYILGRFSRIEQSLRIIEFMPDKISFQNGTTIFPHILISLVPASIIPNRPLTNIGKWFGINFGFTPKKGGVFITAGIMNEFYINFSILGFIGCFVSGILLKKARNYWLANKHYLFANLVYYDIFYTLAFMYNESYIVSGILNIFKSSVFLLIVLTIVYAIDGNRKILLWDRTR